ncbi:fucose-1-phosphate guanylyltransferase-like [Saccoglossus kowalevskii]|uniref:Fucose-1-phosphate guanylyltransferase-like n=1 Tax=Saccoglossus kowalevskii TaxID=10224 RepID=A0ABM0GP37_SACKO|nr:PREDICTED: fucose-1-phosphate guanylyltransferase-like [Saccoglossus kowalevskii]
MATSIQEHIAEATREKLQEYETLRGNLVGDLPFWDLVVITAADEAQASAYKLQIYDKLSKREIPDGITYHVFSDPVGPKIGNGGSTLAALAELEKLHKDLLCNYKILLINAGGMSQRLPHASLLGKIFTAMPVGNPIYQMIDLKLAMYIDLPSRMKPGIFVCSADTIELYDVRGDELQWSFKEPGLTALAHPSAIEIGTGHGVFVLPKQENYKHVKAYMTECLEFLHKPSIAVMRKKGAVIPDKMASDCNTSNLTGANGGDCQPEVVYTDSAFYIDAPTIKKLAEYYRQVQPLQCEIDAYGDFLQALGPNASMDYTNNVDNVVKVTDELIAKRQEIFNLLKGTQLNVIAMNESNFYHLGTTTEYLHHFCCNPSFTDELGSTNDVFNLRMGKSKNADEPAAKMPRISDGKGCTMHSAIKDSLEDSHPFVVEYCNFSAQADIHIGRNCIVSMCCVSGKKRISIPDNTFLHTACVRLEKDARYVTIVLNIHDNLKTKVGQASIGDLVFLGKPLSELFTNFSSDEAKCLFPARMEEYSIWDAKLFPVSDNMDNALFAALDMATIVKQKGQFDDLSSFHVGRISISDILLKKDIQTMLFYRDNLYKINLRSSMLFIIVITIHSTFESLFFHPNLI